MKSLVIKSGFAGILVIGLVFTATALSKPHSHKTAARDTTILIIRHAEKPEIGTDLSPQGERRADAYVQYFSNFKIDSQPVQIDSLIAAADSKQSQRPRLTLKPLSKALGLKINTKIEDKDYLALAEELRSKEHGRTVLVCWHRGTIPELVQALGADPLELLPAGKWPIDQFAWVLQLRFDKDGKLLTQQTKRIEEHLLPEDGR
jgi:broad specificity phosphatase PhoE